MPRLRQYNKSSFSSIPRIVLRFGADPMLDPSPDVDLLVTSITSSHGVESAAVLDIGSTVEVGSAVDTGPAVSLTLSTLPFLSLSMSLDPSQVFNNHDLLQSNSSPLSLPFVSLLRRHNRRASGRAGRPKTLNFD